MLFLKKIFSVFRNIHFQSLMGNGIMAGFGMLTFALLYRVLPEDVGVYLFFVTVLNLTDTLRSGLLTTSFIKFYSGTAKERAHEVAGSAWLIGLLITGVAGIISIAGFIIFRHSENKGLVLFFKYFPLIFLVTLPSFMANIAVQGDKRFDRLLWLRFINQVLFVLAILILYVAKKATAETVVIAYILSNLITSIIIFCLRWTMIRAVKRATRTTSREIFNFGKFSVGTGISANLFNVINTFIINSYLGPTGLAIYNLGGKLIQVIEMPLLSFAASGMPTLAAHYNNDKKQDVIYVTKKMIGMLTTCMLPVTLISLIFAEPIIGLLGGEAYIHTEAPNLFRIFMCVALLYPVDRFLALTLDVIHMPKVNFYKVLVVLAVNIIICLTAIHFFPSVYTIVLSGILPTFLSIAISYRFLTKYMSFNFWNIYGVGAKETLSFLKGLRAKFFTEKKN